MFLFDAACTKHIDRNLKCAFERNWLLFDFFCYQNLVYDAAVQNALLISPISGRLALKLLSVLMEKNAVVANVTQGEFLLLHSLLFHWFNHEYQDHLNI